LNAYLDASALVSIFISDRFSSRIDSFLRNTAPTVIVSDFGAAEVVSALGIRVRIADLSKAQARSIFQRFDDWKRAVAIAVEIDPQDVAIADALLRRLEFVLRTPDALHIAIARRVGAALLTFDDRQAECARTVGVTVPAL
jgi:hypothetical protein